VPHGPCSARYAHNALPGKYASSLARAEELLLGALAHEPDDTLLLAGLGAVLCDQGKRGKATTVLRRAVELGSVDRNPIFNLGVSILSSGAQEQAIQDWGSPFVFGQADRKRRGTLDIRR
jgi:Flp pilus assembly protein TadD